MEQVLLIDDHPALRKGMMELIKELDWMVLAECNSLAQARRVAHTPWTIAVLDLNLPDGHGLDLLRELRTAGRTEPILVHSVLPDTAVASRVFKAGGNGFLNKCSSGEEFQTAVKKVAGGGRYVSPEFAEALAASLGADKPAQLHEQLSEREYQVMLLIAEGKAPTEVAEAMGCNVNTISAYRSRVLKKLNLKTSMDIMRYALTRRLVTF